jgi:hypothetical protein
VLPDVRRGGMELWEPGVSSCPWGWVKRVAILAGSMCCGEETAIVASAGVDSTRLGIGRRVDLG